MAKSGFSEELITFAVDWWAKQLMGEEEENAADVQALNRLALEHPNPHVSDLVSRARDRIKSRITPEKIEVFKTKLRELLIEPYPDGTDPHERPYGCISPRHIQLRTDYQAQGLLLLASKHAGISDMAFPFKTILLIRHGCITTGFPPKTLFEGPAPEGPFGID